MLETPGISNPSPSPNPNRVAALPSPGEWIQHFQHQIVGFLDRTHAPDPSIRYPALLLLGGSEGGVTEWSRSLARLGIVTLSVGYHLGGLSGHAHADRLTRLPKDLTGVKLEAFDEVLEWLRSQSFVDQDRIGVLGISRGGELSLILASEWKQKIRATVAFIPCDRVCIGWSYNIDPKLGQTGEEIVRRKIPAWTKGGAAYCGALDDTVEPLPSLLGRIPVEEITSPIFAASGGMDSVWKPPDRYFECFDVEQISKRRPGEKNPVYKDDVLRQYPAVGHYFFEMQSEVERFGQSAEVPPELVVKSFLNESDIATITTKVQRSGASNVDQVVVNSYRNWKLLNEFLELHLKGLIPLSSPLETSHNDEIP